jgi:pyruvate dehydrogenase E2 component (dihydrolipoamide acetyltransferase)
MPSLGADMSAGKLIAWRKKPGESVERGEILADIDTDKATIEVESFVSGVVEKLLVEPGEEVPVGAVMAVIREEGKPASAPPPPPARRERIRISPAAAKRAAERGVDPATLQGSGPGGRITLEDVERVAAALGAPARPLELKADRQARLRQAIAAAMAKSKREIPHYYLSTAIDMSRALAWLEKENQERSVNERLLCAILPVKAVALALRQFPELNGFWVDGQRRPSEAIHVGVAISLRQGGLIAPALHDADRKSLTDLMREFRDLVQRARAGSLRSSELTDPTITVTSLGDRGVETVFGVIYPPQVALVGFGAIVLRPWVDESGMTARPLMTASLSADHRSSDGHRGGLFLREVARLLQEPDAL